MNNYENNNNDLDHDFEWDIMNRHEEEMAKRELDPYIPPDTDLIDTFFGFIGGILYLLFILLCVGVGIALFIAFPLGAIACLLLYMIFSQ